MFRKAWLLVLVAACGPWLHGGGLQALNGPSLFELGPVLNGTDEPMSRVWDVTVLSDGTLAFLDRGNCRVIHCSRDGRVLHVFGSRGQGPENLNEPGRMVRSGDTLWIADSGNRRIVVLKDWKVAKLVSGRRVGLGPSRLAWSGGRLFVMSSTLSPIAPFNVVVLDTGGRQVAVNKVTLGMGDSPAMDFFWNVVNL